MRAFTALDLGTLPLEVVARLPRRFPAILLLAGGAVIFFVWLEPLVTALARGRPPALLGTYTPEVTFALGLAIITPATVLSGLWIPRRNPLGCRLAFPQLGTVVMLLPGISVSTAWQVAAGVAFTPGEIVGPIAGFAAHRRRRFRADAAALSRKFRCSTHFF